MEQRVTTEGLFNRLQGEEDTDTLRELLCMGIQRPPDFAARLKGEIDKRGLAASQVMKRADVSKTYFYQLLRGERRPGRDVVLRLALALELGVEETQRLLALSGNGALYPRLRRDAAVIFALSRGMSLLETEELLASLPEPPLCGEVK